MLNISLREREKQFSKCQSGLATMEIFNTENRVPRLYSLFVENLHKGLSLSYFFLHKRYLEIFIGNP